MMEPLEPNQPDYSQTAVGITDADVRGVILASLRLVAIFTALTAALFWWRVNWQSAILCLIGAAISATSLWEWMRLMKAVNERMDAGQNTRQATRPMRGVVVGFVGRMVLTLGVLYVSLKYLNGTVFALVAGIALGVISLSFEAIRLMRRGPV
jgi:hypothetical protein